ncbi:unnamed protein product, partial [Iphiclides podalirius]
MSEDTLLFDKSLGRIAFLFRYGGLSLESKGRTTVQTVKTRLLYLFNSSWLNIDLAGGIYWFIDGMMHGKSFVGLTYIAPCIALSLMANLKSLFLIFNEHRIEELTESLRSLERMESAVRVKEKDEIVANERRFLSYVINMLNILNVVLVFTFSVSPLVLMLIKYLKTNEVELILPFLIIYPFNSYDIHYWPFVYMHQFWSECVVILDICSADYLFFTCCSYIKIQFRLLQYDFENIIPENSGTGITQSEDKEYKKKFVELIRRHHMSIRATSLLEAVYSKPTLYNFVSSSMLICLTGFNVMAIEDVALIVTFLVFLFMSLLQIFFLCFFGDMLMRSSMGVSNAVYNSRWYSADPGIAKSLLIVLTRAQKPCKLTAMGFADVNLMAFTSVLSTSWSYFCLLNTMYTPSI